MSNSDNKTWILVLALALGGLWQITRTIAPATAQSVIERERAMETSTRELEPYSVATGARPEPKRALPVVTAAPPDLPRAQSLSPEELAKLQTSVAHVGEISDKKKEEKCEPSRDPKTGKVVPCKTKKKKKKKAADKKTLDALDAATKPKTTTKPKDSDARGIEWNVGAAVQTGQITPPAGQKDDPYDSLQAWETRLLASPDLAATKQFIDHFQRNLVSSDIFYRVTQEMLDDSRSDMKLLGVMCAAVNMSTTSFSMLANFVEKERSGTAPRTQADTALNRYADISSLSILASIMRNSSDYPTFVALQKLDTSIQRNLTTATSTPTPPATPATGATTPGKDGGTATTPATTVTSGLTKNRAQYTRFVAILQGLTKSSDAQIKGQAAQTLSNLQAKLGTTTTPTTPGTPGTPTAPGAPTVATGGTTGQPAS